MRPGANPHRHPQVVRISCRGGEIPLQIEVADSFVSRFRGLMLRGPLATEPLIQSLLLISCSSIHTAFMRYAIDVVYLDRKGEVTRCVPDLKPWRASAAPSSTHTLELPAGSIDRLGITPGCRLLHPLLGTQA